VILYATPNNAVRVFYGFRSPELTSAQFLDGLGETFMPGTPYMLRPVGLAAYLAGAIPEEDGSSCPQEVGLVTWPSQEVQRHATRETLRGRVYTQSHGGVYERARTTARFAVPVTTLPPDFIDPFYLFENNTDWQLGTTYLAVGRKLDSEQAGSEFRSVVRDAMVATRTQLANTGFDQCITGVTEDFVVIWIHSGVGADEPPDLCQTKSYVRYVAGLFTARIICREEPPTIAVSVPSAYNFVFLRNKRFFLA